MSKYLSSGGCVGLTSTSCPPYDAADEYQYAHQYKYSRKETYDVLAVKIEQNADAH